PPPAAASPPGRRYKKPTAAAASSSGGSPRPHTRGSWHSSGSEHQWTRSKAPGGYRRTSARPDCPAADRSPDRPAPWPPAAAGGLPGSATSRRNPAGAESLAAPAEKG